MPIKKPSYIADLLRGRLGEAKNQGVSADYGIYRIVKIAGEKVIQQMKFYTPTNRRKPAQQQHRAKFRDAVIAWRSLTDQAKIEYDVRAEKKQMSGFNLFISEFMSADRYILQENGDAILQENGSAITY